MTDIIDMTPTIAPKSDQLNADDLIAGPRVVLITKVAARTSTPDQPIAISFEGDGGKPYYPCKSMRRVLVAVWGIDAKDYVGKAMQLYCDPDVEFGGMKVGGIRISHMSHISQPMQLLLTHKRSKRAPYVVKPLPEPNQKAASAQKPAPKTLAGAEAGSQQSSSPASDPADLLRLVDKDGKAHDLPPEKWEATLTAALTKKPFDAAASTWADNAEYIKAASETHPDQARRVTDAWKQRKAVA